MDTETRRVLLIEDGVTDAAWVRLTLEDEGEAGSALAQEDCLARGLERLAGGGVDVVLLDLGLPDSEGIETWRRVRQAAPALPVVVLTGLDSEEVAAQAIREGAQDYLVKGRVPAGLLTRALRYAVERKRAERALLDREEQLLQAQKLEAIGRLAGGVAHDFNNLLTVIIGRAEMLVATGGLPARPRREMEVIADTARRAADLTRQLLAFGRKQIVSPQVLDVDGVLARLEDLLRRFVGEEVTLALHAGAAGAHVSMDRAQLEQVLVNLVLNAREAMAAGGRIEVATSVDAAAGAVGPDGEADGRVIIAVSDTGPGMDAGTAARVFEPFFTTKPGKGTGLGLAMVHGIVAQAGGEVRLDTAPGAGATFRIMLPRVAPTPAMAEAGRGEEIEARGLASAVVLVVDDNAGIRELCAEVLERAGYAVLQAGSAEEAQAVAARHAGPLHLLLTDVVMPGVNGTALAEALRAERPALGALFMSGHAEEGIVERGVLKPGAHFLPKPFTPAALLGKVRELLEPGRPAPRRREGR